jgi:hypothetical protein
VIHRITVGVADRPDGVIEPDPGENKRASLAGRRRGLETVQVVAVSNAEFGESGGARGTHAVIVAKVWLLWGGEALGSV